MPAAVVDADFVVLGGGADDGEDEGRESGELEHDVSEECGREGCFWMLDAG